MIGVCCMVVLFFCHRYAHQARSIINVARVNEDPSARIIRGNLLHCHEMYWFIMPTLIHTDARTHTHVHIHTCTHYIYRNCISRCCQFLFIYTLLQITSITGCTNKLPAQHCCTIILFLYSHNRVESWDRETDRLTWHQRCPTHFIYCWSIVSEQH